MLTSLAKMKRGVFDILTITDTEERRVKTAPNITDIIFEQYIKVCANQLFRLSNKRRMDKSHRLMKQTMRCKVALPYFYAATVQMAKFRMKHKLWKEKGQFDTIICKIKLVHEQVRQ